MDIKKQIWLCLLIFALCPLMILPAGAQFIQQGSKLVGTGAVGTPQQGNSVSLSADGNTAIVGGMSDNNIGAAWVFTRSGDVWTQQGNKLVGTGAVGSSGQGCSVSLSADGNTAIVGGLYDNSGQGAAWVYTRSAGVWTQQGSKLVGTGAVGETQQGRSVSLSADGNTAIVGGANDNSGVGAAWVYTRSGSVWTQQGNKLVGIGAVGIAGQGYSVSLSADGNTAIVGGVYDNSSQGAAWVYTRSDGVWTQQGSKLVGTGAVGTPQQGCSVSLSADGNTTIVGGGSDNSGQGAAWIYTRSGGVWTQQGNKLVGTGAVGNAYQGGSVSVSADGNTTIVSGENDNSGAGAAWVYTRSGSVWTQQRSKLFGTGAVGNAYQGGSVSVSADGNTAIVGGIFDNSDQGAAWVYYQDKAAIVSISDIPHDQGGNVRIKWNRVLHDTAGISWQTTSYGIWRKIPSDFSFRDHKRSVQPQGMSLLYDSLSLYDYLMTVNAVQIPYYNVVVPTLEDSSESGIPYFTFLITAHTADPNFYYVSKPDSGYSVDNLSPALVTGLNAIVQAGPNVELDWNPNITDHDVGRYDIYRSEESGFTPYPSLKIGTSTSPTFIDALPEVGVNNYYRVVTVDVHGNESVPSGQAVAAVTVSRNYGVSDKWNMISVPLQVNDYTKAVLYPTSTSDAFAYEGTYISNDTLINGIGYWVKFSEAQNVEITGLYREVDTIDVLEGWNMIGSLSEPIRAVTIASDPPGMVTSQLFGYNGTYVTSDTMYPGKGYWIKVNQEGKLILISVDLDLAKTQATRIHIIPTSELPPAPPDDSISAEKGIPKEYGLGQAYPNPFNPTTTISYQLPENSDVRIHIYNALGEVITVPINEIEEAGFKSVNWNASGMASGVYFYRLEATSVSDPGKTFTQVKKMILLR